MNDRSNPKFHRIAEESLHGLARLIADDAALAAFLNAALDDDLWRQAQADPCGYFTRAGIDIPDFLDMNLQSPQVLKPWPPTIPELQMVTVRCWWVWARVDGDEEPVKPFLFCLKVPAILLDFIRR